MIEFLHFFGGLTFLTKEFFKELFKKPFGTQLIIEQIFHIGHRSLPLVLITAISTGMVMTLQFGVGLAKFGGTLYVPRIVTLSIFREMGPVFTALMIAARVGAGMASEIGSMTVTQQIDAIRAMATSPIKKIVVPRVIACLIALPILVAVANLLGFFGGLIVGVSELQLDGEFYALKALNNLRPADYISGFGKSFFFAFFIAIPACYFGLNVKDGTKGVGIATTKAVVVSSIMILVGDFFITKFFWIIERWL
jgi:phospholipid/cholesterol/gamma-HCH transport system permease protein